KSKGKGGSDHTCAASETGFSFLVFPFLVSDLCRLLLAAGCWLLAMAHGRGRPCHTTLGIQLSRCAGCPINSLFVGGGRRTSSPGVGLSLGIPRPGADSC